MKERDKRIIESLKKFRCLTRDDLIDLYFSGLSNPINSCNMVMRRLVQRKCVEVKRKAKTSIYFSCPALVKKDSQKIGHYLKIVQFYKIIKSIREPTVFDVEVKFKKGFCEPDIFMIWNNTPFFVEIQNSYYTRKMMKCKFDRYTKLYMDGSWKNEPWQRMLDQPTFPIVWIVSKNTYNIDDLPYLCFPNAFVGVIYLGPKIDSKDFSPSS